MSAYRRAKRWEDIDASRAKEREKARAKGRSSDPEQVKRAYAKRRALLDELKARPCMDCGQTFPSECMDFDHRPGEDKLGNIGFIYKGALVRLLAEIEKCDLVCANCHRVRTRKRASNA